MPDCSLVVTTFSRQSWLLLQRMATRVTSMGTFVDLRASVRSTHAGFMPIGALCVSLGRPVGELTQRDPFGGAFWRSADKKQHGGNRDCGDSRGARVDDSQSVELRERAEMAMTVFTLQQP